MKRLLLLIVFGTLLAVPIASAKGTTATPTISPTVNPIVVGSGFTWQGCGYQPQTVLRLTTTLNGISAGISDLFVDQAGCFVSGVWVVTASQGPGTEVATVWRLSPTIGKPTKVLASVTVPVVA